MQLRSIRSAPAAALLLSLVPAPAFAEGAGGSTPPAVATGLAIPVGGPHRASPVPVRGRAVLVDAASARLYMIQNGRVVDSMRVIVGSPDTATPQLRSTLWYATINPYWNVTAELTRTLIAPNVLRLGYSYLRDRGYEVVTEFGKDAKVLPPESVDWKAVAAGREKVLVRQRPGPANSMGELKFNIPNSDGIYLHDTPRKALFAEDNRSLSHGCVRLEDAPRLARWLLGREPNLDADAPERHVPVPGGVPIVITYLDPAAQVQMAAALN
ncbi:MAG TPA: L,D-transpeptidase family protein [Sphingomicrobium sp.]|nr:L,D-transpeptidase family protein [Sphingomicrobium sp.]